MNASAGNFFPPEYKRFPFKEGDLLASARSDGRFSVNKVLRVDRFNFPKGKSININGSLFETTEDDWLLVIGMAYGKSEFNSLDDARAAAKRGTWTVQLGHIPGRPPGAAEGQTWVGNAPVNEEELEGYRIWREAFDAGEAGIF